MSREYLDPFNTNFWSESEDVVCPCQGNGWATINGIWEECSVHYHGQLHPDSKALLLDDPLQLVEAERASVLQWKIANAREEVRRATVALKLAQMTLQNLELEQINRTTTTKIKVVIPEEAK